MVPTYPFPPPAHRKEERVTCSIARILSARRATGRIQALAAPDWCAFLCHWTISFGDGHGYGDCRHLPDRRMLRAKVSSSFVFFFSAHAVSAWSAPSPVSHYKCYDYDLSTR